MVQEFLQFVIQNWFLWVLFLALIAAVAWFEMRTVVGGVVKQDAQAMVALMNHENATIIDIRDAGSYGEGHIIDAINLQTMDAIEKHKKLSKQKAKPIVVVCANGQKSLNLAQAMKKQGFEKMHILKGGMATWKSASLPLQKNQSNVKKKEAK